MLKAVGLLVGALLAPLQPIDENEICRNQMATQIRKMVGLSDSIPPFTAKYLHARPKTFCNLLMHDCHQEITQGFQRLGIKLDTKSKTFDERKRKKMRDEDDEEIPESHKPASKKVKMAIQQLAQKRGIKEEIRIINSTDRDSLGEAGVAEISFNEEQWEDYFNKNKNVLTYIGGHEVAHIFHQDVVTIELVREQILNMPIHAQKVEACKYLLQFCRFHEVRADIESAFGSKGALNGFEFWAKRDMEVDGDKGDEKSIHPPTSYRLQLAALLKTLQKTYKPQPRKYKAKK